MAEEMYRQALVGRKEIPGEEHRDTLVIINNLVALLYAQEKFEAAEEMI